MDSSTIVAVASPPGCGRRGILRLSGREARAIANRALVAAAGGSADIAARAPRHGFRARLDDGAGRQPVLVLWMPGPHSYTGEDVVELHLPGAAPLLARALERLLALGARPAEPGEFTRRAFLNGRIGLAEVEGLLALVGAESEGERRAALGLLEGGLSARMLALRGELDELRALCEASLDFDEDDAGHVPLAELERRLASIEARLAEASAAEASRPVPSALPRVALAGAPNAGKSSLWNALVTGGRALVGDEPGTTRDVLVGSLSLGCGEVLLVDLAGDDPGARGPDELGQRRARVEREAAALLLWIVDARRLCGPDRERLLAELPGPARALAVLAQVDLLEPQELAALRRGLPGRGPGGWLAVSARSGAGLDELRAALALRLGLGRESRPGGDPSRELFLRHRAAFQRAHGLAARTRRELGKVPLDVSAETLRQSSAALDDVMGRTTSEDLLDRIFARFCLGK